MKIINLTPHPLSFFRREDVVEDSSLRKLFLKEGKKPALEIPSAGRKVSAKLTYKRISPEGEIPELFKFQVEGIDPLPEGHNEDCIFVVSALYLSAAKALGYDTSRLATVSQPVYKDPDNPRPVGCLGLNIGG